MKHKVSLRKIILGVSTIGMLGVTLTTSTYAWFKLNAKANVENFNISVIGGKGFMVSIDGGTYTNNLTSEQMKKAITVGLKPTEFEIGYETDSDGNIIESNVLYRIYRDTNNEISRKKVDDVDTVLEETMRTIQLLPTTSKDGRSFTDLYSGSVSAMTGKLVEFGVYFKSTSSLLQDELKYDIYLDAYNGLDENGNQVVPTSITSVVNKVALVAPMNTFEYYTDGDVISKQLVNKNSGSMIDVYSSNALRISTTVSNKEIVDAHYELTKNVTFVDGKKYYITNDSGITYEEVNVVAGDEIPADTYYEFIDEGVKYNADEDSSLIYELNDTQNLHTDLGSYATDYTESTATHTDDYFNYSSECNAMFTYYNHLRSSNKLTALAYNEKPKTIKSLPTESSENIKSSDYDTITTVESGKDEKLITFRMWLEGWDADCFDGLAHGIDVKLSFGSKRVN